MVNLNQRKNEIGGLFSFPFFDCTEISKSVLHYLINSSGGNNYTFVEDGRQAIKKVLLEIKDVQKLKCYLPSYLCHSILQPFIEIGLNINFYGHTHPLRAEIDDDISDSIILIIDYFGTEFFEGKKIKELLENGNKVIIDVTHSIFDKTRRLLSHDNLFYISSLRKVLPIPDGAIIFHSKDFNYPGLNYSLNITPMLNAMLLKNMYLSDMIELLQINPLEMKSFYLSLSKNSEEDKDKQVIHINPISPISLMILSHISFDTILEQRNVNLFTLYDKIINKKLFLFCYESIKSPFIFPIYLNNNRIREELRHKLIINNIFPPIHWEVQKIVPEKFVYEHQLSNRILSIPIDQRYSTIDMQRIINILNQDIAK
jgi:hypothetical protein